MHKCLYSCLLMIHSAGINFSTSSTGYFNKIFNSKYINFLRKNKKNIYNIAYNLILGKSN